MSKYFEKCSHCGNIVYAYSHNLNQPLVKALFDLVGLYEQLKRPLNLQKDLELTKNQYNNFQKLKYFDLVSDIPGTAGWVPTSRGIDFIYGKIAIRNIAVSFGNKILAYNHQAWKSVRFGIVYVQDVDRKCYKQKIEYQQEHDNQLKIEI